MALQNNRFRGTCTKTVSGKRGNPTPTHTLADYYGLKLKLKFWGDDLVYVGIP